MAVFRVEKTRNYTVMSNYHLRDKSLSLKAKGLLSLMLSLPEDWDYTTKGLARICKDGVDSICATVRELEGAGYIVRERERHADGRLGGAHGIQHQLHQLVQPCAIYLCVTDEIIVVHIGHDLLSVCLPSLHSALLYRLALMRKGREGLSRIRT